MSVYRKMYAALDDALAPELESIHRQAFAAGRLAGLREAAGVAKASKGYDDNLQRSAGCATSGERISAAILALAEGKEG